VLTTSAATFATVNTGYGANELYEMNQNVQTTSDVDFNSVDAQEFYLNTVNKTDIFKYPYEPYTYQIGIINGTTPPVYYAKNGHTGTVTSNADFNTLLNSVYAATPPFGRINVKGDVTFTSPLTILKPIILTIDGTVTVNGTDFIIIGDTTHFVKGGEINLNVVDGLDRSHNGIVLRDCTAITFHFNKLLRFNTAILMDPRNGGVGCGENHFYGGWVTRNNIGVGSNATGFAGWAQGNFFICSIYASLQYGVKLTGPPECQYTFMKGVSDNIAGVDPDEPAAGGGIDFYDTIGNNWFEYLYQREDYGAHTYYTIHPSSRLISDGVNNFGMYPTYFRSETYLRTNATLTIGLSDVWSSGYATYTGGSRFEGTTLGWKPPYYIKFIVGGAVAGGETISVAVQYEYNGGQGNAFTKTFAATGTYYLTNGELMELYRVDDYFSYVNAFAKTDQAATNATVSVVYGGMNP